jgi:hypothetical protein
MVKPVAWGYRYSDGNIYDVICPEEHDRLEGMYTVPLYTAPRELSDEEIHDIWKSQWESGNIGHIAYNFARAILKKAGEK